MQTALLQKLSSPARWQRRGQAEKDAISWCVITWDWY
jgi:hypothetical protein